MPVQVRALKYLHLADELRRQMTQGELQPGDRVPSRAEMQARFKVSGATVEKVHSLLEQDGLVVREQGRGTFVKAPTARRRLNVIGCAGLSLKERRSCPYWVHLLDGIQHAADMADHQVLLLNAESAVGWDKMDGVLVHEEPGQLRQLPEAMPRVAMMVPQPTMPSVAVDDYAAGHLAGEHLLALGHSRIGTLMFADSPLPDRRLAGLRDAMATAGVAPDPALTRRLRALGGSQWESGRQSMAEWLQEGWRGSGCTALLGQNDEVAAGAMHALQSNGYRVPRDISIIGFDGTEVGERTNPALTSVQVPLQEIGRQAMELLLRQIDGEVVELKELLLAAEMRVRQSTDVARG